MITLQTIYRQMIIYICRVVRGSSTGAQQWQTAARTSHRRNRRRTRRSPATRRSSGASAAHCLQWPDREQWSSRPGRVVRRANTVRSRLAPPMALRLQSKHAGLPTSRRGSGQARHIRRAIQISSRGIRVLAESAKGHPREALPGRSPLGRRAQPRVGGVTSPSASFHPQSPAFVPPHG
jgi:hypothetical protein